MDDVDRKRRIYQELLAEVRESEPKKREYEISINDLATDLNIGKDYAKKILEGKVTEGIFTKRKTSRGTFYSPV